MNIFDSISKKFGNRPSDTNSSANSDSSDSTTEAGYISYFKNHLQEFADKYSSDSLIEKVGKCAKTAGLKLIYQALLIYHGLLYDEVPVSCKLLAVAALGYFISPLDLIPDFIPGGLFDDGTILAFALVPLYSSLNERTKREAITQLHTWFGDFDESELPKL